MFEKIALFSNKQVAKKLSFLSYAIVGITVFAFNANLDSHPYLQIYVTLLEAKLGIVFVYLLNKNLGKINKEKRST